jgi:hypothetical protein
MANTNIRKKAYISKSKLAINQLPSLNIALTLILPPNLSPILAPAPKSHPDRKTLILIHFRIPLNPSE